MGRSGDSRACGPIRRHHDQPGPVRERHRPDMKDMPMRFATLLISSALLPVAVLGQETPYLLDQITIEGGLTPIERQAYGRANTVLTAEEIRARGVRSVQDALRSVPGLSVSSLGASNTQIRIRGAEGNHTLVLIDGIRAAAGDSEYYLSGLDTANIERIEVLRGPQSVFFGADASAGVVNIITRQPGGSGVEAGGSVEIGNGWSASVHASNRDDRGGVSFTAATRDDDGYDHSGDGGEDDGIRRSAAQLSFDRQLTDTISAGMLMRYAEEEYDYDATSWTAMTADEYVIDADLYAERKESAGRIWAEAETLNGRLVHRLSYDQTRFELSQNGGAADKARTDIWRYRGAFGLDGPYFTATQTLTLGLERREDENSVASDQNRASNSVILEYRGAFANGLDVQLGLRHDNNDLFKNASTWSLGLSYEVPGVPVRLHGSAGTGVVNPSYLELYGGYGYAGNPGLKPEENRGFDIGAELHFAGGRGVADLTYFQEELENEISFSGIPLADGTNYYNQDGVSKRRGVELSADFQASDALSLGFAYTYLHAKDPDGQVEIRRPRHTLGLTADYRFAEGRGNLSGEVLYVAGNYDSQYFGSYETAELPEYTVVNVAAGYDVTDRVRATGRVVNLFDEDYFDSWGYAMQGRTAYLGLQAKW
ncbi:TonB-dependent receptor plug domain-containing protein [Paracoccus aerodenitrificans]|uniref:TonB-dependent receptor plug domain-containing protein n=1 Tax=Paracoccus aerodenitrificans TaxID=3017781 RepID=UPI0022F09306|nr:TonB-dependent receptor [Paracoccus aerodenitrificans]WBU63988.1 TonB-dependent receptor [Paracoccus aerodenitrificans]